MIPPLTKGAGPVLGDNALFRHDFIIIIYIIYITYFCRLTANTKGMMM